MFYFKAGALIGLIVKPVDMKKNTSLVEFFLQSLLSSFVSWLDWLYFFIHAIFHNLSASYISDQLEPGFVVVVQYIHRSSQKIQWSACEYPGNYSMQDTLTSRARHEKALSLLYTIDLFK